MKLYEITQEYLSVFDEISKQGFDSDTIKNTMEPIEKSFDEKAKNIVAYIKNLEQDILSLQEHKSNIESRIKSYKQEHENYRNYLKDNMIACSINKISCPFFDIYLTNTTPTLIKEDELNIPTEYYTEKVELVLDNQRLKNDIKNGRVIEGIYLKENKALKITCTGRRRLENKND